MAASHHEMCCGVKRPSNDSCAAAILAPVNARDGAKAKMVFAGWDPASTDARSGKTAQRESQLKPSSAAKLVEAPGIEPGDA
ncbi:MAG TPA: hypothetical protein VG963_23375, partial [Polyangiaceae bacterium]|nr:hypothetical protein [Polyangiaceae bacterium]